MAKGGFYSNLVDNVEKLAGNIQSKIYGIAREIFNSELSMIILVLTLCFYIYTKIGKDWNREDFYKMGVWLITYCVIVAIFYSEKNYEGFIYAIELPINWIYANIQSVNINGTTLNIDGGLDKVLNWVDSITANILNKVKLTQIITYIFILLAVFRFNTNNFNIQHFFKIRFIAF